MQPASITTLARSRRTLAGLLASLGIAATALLASAAAHAALDPIILIPGMTGTPSNMYPMRDFLVRNGWQSNRVYPWTDADQMNKDMDASARAISAKVDSVLRETGARKVVIAAWSAGTIATRNYIKNYGGDTKVSQFISIAGPHHGISNFRNCFEIMYPACARQWGPVPNTAWLRALNEGTEVPGWPNVRYLTMRGTADTNAVPVDTAILNGADENVLFQGLNHSTLITDNAPLTKMRDFIRKWSDQTDGPNVSSCTAAVNGGTATVSATAQGPAPIVGYRVRLIGPTGVDDNASVSGTSFSKAYPLADGAYTGTVTATDNLGRVSPACQIARFTVGQPPANTGHDPVIIGTGMSGDLTKMEPIRDSLIANGWRADRVFLWKDASGFSGDVPTTARELGSPRFQCNK